MAMQSTKDSSVETVAAVAQTLETWGDTDVVLHADGEAGDEIAGEGDCERTSASDSAEARSTLQSSEGPVEACIQVCRGIFVANKLALEAGIACRPLLKHPCDCVVGKSRCLADDPVQHWTRWLLAFQEDLRQAV